MEITSNESVGGGLWYFKMRTTSIFDLFGQSVRIDLRYGSQLLHFHFVKKKTLNARSNNNTQQQGITEKEKKHAHTHTIQTIQTMRCPVNCVC